VVRVRVVELKPIREEPSDYDEIEKVILYLLRSEIYYPLLPLMGSNSAVLKNSFSDLLEAITYGKIAFSNGKFTGKFNSAISRELRKIGAKWDRGHGWYSIPRSKLPIEVKNAISMSEVRFAEKLSKIDAAIAKISPAEIADKLKIESLFDKTIWKVERKFQASVRGITIAPKLTEQAASRVAAEYTNNLQLYIKDFVEKETIELRQQIALRVAKGQRYEGIARSIQDSYGVSQNKAKFLARQETSLLMTKYKQVRYQESGVNEYKWKCVAGSPNHPVRPMHKMHDGKIYRWDKPPVINSNGDRRNPGQDYNCRCVAIPIVRF
jgi:SPP1 gp7 family putative phage head morphogenesis protein